MQAGDWKKELDRYALTGNPENIRRSFLWKNAIGLQAVDGLKVSEFLLSTAKKHIEGEIDEKEAAAQVSCHYREPENRRAAGEGTFEADTVAAGIVEVLTDKRFSFSPIEWQGIHRRLFNGVFNHAGRRRDCDIMKQEWVLDGDTVRYVSAMELKDAANYDFAMEKSFSYDGITLSDFISHISGFTAGIWQIHPFYEGNTRTTAVFILKYLMTFGYILNNDMFTLNSWYFRNALVRANYRNSEKGIEEDRAYLEAFFECLLTNRSCELDNGFLHVDYRHENGEPEEKVSGKDTVPLLFSEQMIINALSMEGGATVKRLAGLLGKTEKAVMRELSSMREKGIVSRDNG